MHRSIQESIWVSKRGRFYLIPHINRKTPARSSYNYHHSLPSPVCTYDETGFNYTCHFHRNLALLKLGAEQLCLFGKLKITFSHYLNVNFASPDSFILE